MIFYELQWFGKEEMLKNFNKNFEGKIIPEKEKSVNYDTTKNFYIEGDNIDILKAMLPKYQNKIDIIYIDPPYNTGKTFLYDDNFHIKDKKLNKSDKLHSNWLNMMYPRLLLAKDLLREDGVIFISIDEYEFYNLKIICNEIFDEENFIDTIIWEKNNSPVNQKKNFSNNHEYILVYAKKINKILCNGVKRSEKRLNMYKNPDNDNRGDWVGENFSMGYFKEEKYYKIISPNGKEHYPPDGRCWRYSEKKYKELLEDNRIWFGKDGKSKPKEKLFLSEIKQTIPPLTVWKSEEVGTYKNETKNLKNLFNNKWIFNHPKPVELIKKCISLYSKKDSIILDFFSGTGTTSQAVMELNAEDKGNRQFIMIQEPVEFIKDKTNLSGDYKTICDIARERIKKAGDKILNDFSNENSLDIGFKVFKVIKD